MSKNKDDFLSNILAFRLVKESPLVIHYSNEHHVLMFRRILELALSQGRWAGSTYDLS